jgi:uncharacterized protein (UPF0212 family)
MTATGTPDAVVGMSACPHCGQPSPTYLMATRTKTVPLVPLLRVVAVVLVITFLLALAHG